MKIMLIVDKKFLLGLVNAEEDDEEDDEDSDFGC